MSESQTGICIFNNGYKTNQLLFGSKNRIKLREEDH